MNELQEFIDALARWSDQAFGVERPPEAPIRHLKKEVDELLEQPLDAEEYADCFMLLMDAWRKTGGDARGIIDEAWKKLDVCKNREWEHSGDGVFERKGKHGNSTNNDN